MHPALDEALAVESTWKKKKNATAAKEEGDRSSSDDGCDSLADMLVVWFHT